MQWLRSIFSDDDWDIDAVLVGLVLAVGACIYFQYRDTGPWDAQKFGSGIGYLLGGGGVGYGARRFAEKKGGNDVGLDSDIKLPKE